MSQERCPCGEDTPEGCAERPAKHCGRVPMSDYTAIGWDIVQLIRAGKSAEAIHSLAAAREISLDDARKIIAEWRHNATQADTDLRNRLDEAVATENAVRSDGEKQDPYPKRELLHGQREAEIARMQAGIWLNATVDARLMCAHLRTLCIAAHEFLASPALASIRIGDRRWTREELIETLSMVNPP